MPRGNMVSERGEDTPAFAGLEPPRLKLADRQIERCYEISRRKGLFKAIRFFTNTRHTVHASAQTAV